MRISKTLIAVLAAAVLPGAASAATIVSAGALIDIGASWRTPSAANTLFTISASGVLGSDGYYFPGNQGAGLQPGYISSASFNGSVYGGNGDYASIDNPITTPGATPTTLTTGTFNPFPGNGVGATTFTFTLAAGTPHHVRLGLLIDNLDIAAYNSSAVEVGGLISGSTTVGLTGTDFNNRAADWLYFDILGGAGETFSVVSFGGQLGCGCLGGVSFDSVVPEPATWLLMVAGFGLVGTAVRRQPRAVAA